MFVYVELINSLISTQLQHCFFPLHFGSHSFQHTDPELVEESLKQRRRLTSLHASNDSTGAVYSRIHTRHTYTPKTRHTPRSRGLHCSFHFQQYFLGSVLDALRSTLGRLICLSRVSRFRDIITLFWTDG